MKKIDPNISAYFRQLSLKRKHKVGGFKDRTFAKLMSEKGNKAREERRRHVEETESSDPTPEAQEEAN